MTMPPLFNPAMGAVPPQNPGAAAAGLQAPPPDGFPAPVQVGNQLMTGTLYTLPQGTPLPPQGSVLMPTTVSRNGMNYPAIQAIFPPTAQAPSGFNVLG